MRKFWSYEEYAAWRDEGDHSDIPVKLIGDDCRIWPERYGSRIALNDANIEITSLRERLEQEERERDNYKSMYESSLVAAVQMKRDGFRAGIEAAAKWLETVPQELQDRQIIVRNIRALAEQKDGEQ